MELLMQWVQKRVQKRVRCGAVGVVLLVLLADASLAADSAAPGVVHLKANQLLGKVSPAQGGEEFSDPGTMSDRDNALRFWMSDSEGADGERPTFLIQPLDLTGKSLAPATPLAGFVFSLGGVPHPQGWRVAALSYDRRTRKRNLETLMLDHKGTVSARRTLATFDDGPLGAPQVISSGPDGCAVVVLRTKIYSACDTGSLAKPAAPVAIGREDFRLMSAWFNQQHYYLLGKFDRETPYVVKEFDAQWRPTGWEAAVDNFEQGPGELQLYTDDQTLLFTGVSAGRLYSWSLNKAKPRTGFQAHAAPCAECKKNKGGPKLRAVVPVGKEHVVLLHAESRKAGPQPSQELVVAVANVRHGAISPAARVPYASGGRVEHLDVHVEGNSLQVLLRESSGEHYQDRLLVLELQLPAKADWSVAPRIVAP